MQQRVDVNTVMVGAGPIALLNAIGLLTRNPNRKVVLIEKYDQYQRSHTLKLKSANLRKYLEACGSKGNPVISALIEETYKNPYIRINEIEQRLNEEATRLGAEIIKGHAVEDFEEEVLDTYPNADLIIGADGAHSLVSAQAIGKSYAFKELTASTQLQQEKMYFRVVNGQLTYSVIDNSGRPVRDQALEGDEFMMDHLDMGRVIALKQAIFKQAAEHITLKSNTQKEEFDFGLQFRFEVKGAQVEWLPLPALFSLMQNYGINCTEAIGKPDPSGNIPVTFQLIITKQQFEVLKNIAKSGHPILPFGQPNDPRTKAIPEELMRQINGYLGLRLRHFTKSNEIVNLDSATLSVNETPATYALQAHKRITDRHGTPRDIVLVGDALMGLSYYIGFNAGIIGSARLLEPISQPFDEREVGLNRFNEWFSDTFAPAKVNEVRRYSTYVIRASLAVNKALHFILRSDTLMRTDAAELTLALYRGHLANIIRDGMTPKWKATFEHNSKLLENVLTYKADDASEILSHRIPNMFKDVMRPYKSPYHVRRDLMIPISAVTQLTKGTWEITSAVIIELMSGIAGVMAPGKKSRKTILQECGNSFIAREAEGFSRVLLGANLTVFSVLMPFKVIVRSIMSWTHQEPLLIENNPGMKRLIKQSNMPEVSPALSQLHSLSVDVHRKFKKSMDRGQETRVDVERERTLYTKCLLNRHDNDYRKYLALFGKPETDKREDDTGHLLISVQSV